MFVLFGVLFLLSTVVTLNPFRFDIPGWLYNAQSRQSIYKVHPPVFRKDGLLFMENTKYNAWRHRSNIESDSVIMNTRRKYQTPVKDYFSGTKLLQA